MKSFSLIGSRVSSYNFVLVVIFVWFLIDVVIVYCSLEQFSKTKSSSK